MTLDYFFSWWGIFLMGLIFYLSIHGLRWEGYRELRKDKKSDWDF